MNSELFSVLMARSIEAEQTSNTKYEVYKNIIMTNEGTFQNKEVIVLGDETGKLSILFARFGKAKHVYTLIEYPDTALQKEMEQIMKKHKVEEKVQVFTKISDIKEKLGKKKVDIVASNWFGFQLFSPDITNDIKNAFQLLNTDGGVTFPTECEFIASFWRADKFSEDDCILDDHETCHVDIKGTTKMSKVKEPKNGKIFTFNYNGQDAVGKELLFTLEKLESEATTTSCSVQKSDGEKATGLCLWFNVKYDEKLIITSDPWTEKDVLQLKPKVKFLQPHCKNNISHHLKIEIVEKWYNISLNIIDKDLQLE